jgi:hypothetical protein
MRLALQGTPVAGTAKKNEEILRGEVNQKLDTNFTFFKENFLINIMIVLLLENKKIDYPLYFRLEKDKNGVYRSFVQSTI